MAQAQAPVLVLLVFWTVHTLDLKLQVQVLLETLQARCLAGARLARGLRVVQMLAHVVRVLVVRMAHVIRALVDQSQSQNC